ncbi:DUF2911 domain-containing protein [uncultured Psychroserpens sp.]|uniref:DUF2911 domain-containing protein n=1 Tax=uncultured Psychroserpens sp. TaxID=255436 RepID=UPI00262A3037|nr:DUF2911 domain-containing protein [uncultured Psychroserpens sp.]
MKYLFKLICLLFFITSYSQDQTSFDKLSHISSRASVMQRIGITKIEINYYRPNINEREVWDDLVPYNKVWRAGANFSTTIEFSTNVIINGSELSAGKYALFILPTENEWTFIFDTQSLQFGTFFYRGQSDALRVKVKPTIYKDYNVKSLIYFFEDINFNKGNLTLAWADREASINISTSEEDIKKEVTDYIQKARETKNVIDYTNAVNWALDHDMMIEEAKVWLMESKQIKEIFGNNFLLARFAEHEGDYKKAIEIAQEVEKKFPQFKSVTDSFINRWQKKI